MSSIVELPRMAIFSDTEQNALDFVALREGGITKYLRQDYLGEDITWLELAGYKVVRLACEEWSSEHDMHASLSSALSFPDYYGMNLNALDGNGLNRYVQSATLNGVNLPNAWFRHGQIKDGATLILTMGPAPSSWGQATPPPSMSDADARSCAGLSLVSN